MENRKNLCAMIPACLHAKVREEQEKMELKLNEYVEMIIKEHFEKGDKTMANGTRTLAFQVSEELFNQIKAHLKRTGLSQKDFVIGLIEQALAAGQAEQPEEAAKAAGKTGAENE
ncbi:4-oxalocrotonate tautomerase [Enterocloster bolteae]|uniref:4-oxalocrotonate tautomerase n=1 Tax=Enterocloster bolteae TaxID=208479 RepID=UPI00210CC8CB|nr:4-oxalocrotonate tautomerase [Enterocloster bolteae]MCQ5144483.1 4-oxalocrotonate tautomerase [Enterocloster bolteae]